MQYTTLGWSVIATGNMASYTLVCVVCKLQVYFSCFHANRQYSTLHQHDLLNKLNGG